MENYDSSLLQCSLTREEIIEREKLRKKLIEYLETFSEDLERLREKDSEYLKFLFSDIIDEDINNVIDFLLLDFEKNQEFLINCKLAFALEYYGKLFTIFTLKETEKILGDINTHGYESIDKLKDMLHAVYRSAVVLIIYKTVFKTSVFQDVYKLNSNLRQNILELISKYNIGDYIQSLECLNRSCEICIEINHVLKVIFPNRNTKHKIIAKSRTTAKHSEKISLVFDKTIGCLLKVASMSYNLEILENEKSDDQTNDFLTSCKEITSKSFSKCKETQTDFHNFLLIVLAEIEKINPLQLRLLEIVFRIRRKNALGSITRLQTNYEELLHKAFRVNLSCLTVYSEFSEYYQLKTDLLQFIVEIAIELKKAFNSIFLQTLEIGENLKIDPQNIQYLRMMKNNSKFLNLLYTMFINMVMIAMPADYVVIESKKTSNEILDIYSFVSCIIDDAQYKNDAMEIIISNVISQDLTDAILDKFNISYCILIIIQVIFAYLAFTKYVTEYDSVKITEILAVNPKKQSVLDRLKSMASSLCCIC